LSGASFWIPAECDVPLRPGWFYHPDQDSKVKTPAELFELYLFSVGRGGALDLGIAPDTRGRLHENDVRSLDAFGKLLEKTFKNDLAKSATITASNTRSSAYSTSRLTDGDRYSYWSTADSVHTPSLIMEWKEEKEFDLLRIRENIKLGQRVEAFAVDAFVNNAWQEIINSTSIGSERILVFPVQKTKKIRIRITQCPVVPAISEIGIFRKPVSG